MDAPYPQEDEPEYYEACQAELAPREDYISVCYDIEAEQKTDGLPLLLTFIVIGLRGIVNVAGTIPHVMDGDLAINYFSGPSCIKRFQQFLCKLTMLHKLIYLVAHNGNKFDHLYVLNKITDVGFAVIRCLQKPTHLIQAHLRGPTGGMLITKDSFKFAYSPLSAFKCAAGGKLEFDPSNFRVDTYEDPKFLQYCARDTHILGHLWGVVLPAWFAPIKPVLASYARGFAYYCSGAHIAYNYIMGCTQSVYKIIGAYYRYGQMSCYGGKCDSMIYGSNAPEKVKVFDVTSMYPACMNAPMPHGKFRHYRNYYVNWRDFNCYENNPFVAQVVLQKDPSTCQIDHGYGIVPLHIKRYGKKLLGNLQHYTSIAYVSCGTIKGVYTSVDIQAAIMDGWRVMEANHFIVWEGWTMQYADCYKEWFEVKNKEKHKDPNKYWFAKLILNSSIGKFMQKPFVSSTGKPAYLGWFCLSGTRLQHLQMKVWAIDRGLSAIYYGDTDSIFIPFDMRVPAKWMRPELGTPLQITGQVEDVCDILIVLGKKLYCASNNGVIVKCGHKGFKSLSLSEYLYVLANDVFTQDFSMPDKHFRYDGKNITCGVTMFWNRTKQVKKTIPELKFKHAGLYFNKLIKMYYILFVLYFI